MPSRIRICRSIALVLCAAPLLATGTAQGADVRALADARKVYQQDRAACLAGFTVQDRETCLKEAGAAYADARRGRLEDGNAAFEKNRYLRCEPLPPDDKQDCIRRMNGEGTVSGSVEGGGIYRELRTLVPAE